MTVQGHRSAEVWQDPEFAKEWTAGDKQGELLDLPRRIAAALVADDRPGTAVVIDVASGPGAFLEIFLDAFPTAHGIWSDASEAMQEEATRRLARFGDRVEFILADMTDLRGGGLPAGVDVVTTSRASHHLDRDTLHAFYTEAASLLAPGGWLVNLDHIGPQEPWNQRLRAAKKHFGTRRTAEEGTRRHHHNAPLCGVDDHLDGYRAAGVTDVEMPWKAFYTVLLAGRVADGS